MFAAVPAPAVVDIEAAYAFACTCQDALSVFVGEDDPLELFSAIHRALQACPDALYAIYMTRVAMALVGFARQVLRQLATTRFDDDGMPRVPADRVRSALRRVLAWHQRPALTLGEIADCLGVGAQYLSESINRLSNRGFREHLHAIRVIHAAVLLVETRDSIDLIATHVGYLTAPHLTRHFHRLLHVTPARFRVVAYGGSARL